MALGYLFLERKKERSEGELQKKREREKAVRRVNSSSCRGLFQQDISSLVHPPPCRLKATLSLQTVFSYLSFSSEISARRSCVSARRSRT